MYPNRIDSRAPAVVSAAVALTWLLVGLYVVRAVLTFVLFDSLIDNWADSRGGGGLPRELAEQGAPAYRPIALVSAVVIGGLLTVVAVFLARGQAWARVMGTVVGVLAVLGGLIGLLQPATAPFKLIGLMIAVVAAAAIVLMWLPGTGPFFRSRRPG